MPSERVQRRLDRLLDQAEEAVEARDWSSVRDAADAVLAVDPENEDALTFLSMAARRLGADDSPGAGNGRTGASAGSNRVGGQAEQDPANSQAPASPASFASGRYLVTKFLGEGGKKRVYLARDNRLDRDVAFALIKTDGLDEVGRERVRREAQAMGRMGTHPCIMPIYDLGDESGQPFMVQPLMGGGDVEGLIVDAEGPLPLDQAITIATQTAQGLAFAHGKGIVHRDLKPGNVWLDEDGSAKIGDFGLAVATDRSRLTVEKVMVGTVNYMPPEQATGGEVTPRADLYSLGAMLYEMCTGRVPFMGDDEIGVISQHINTPPVAPSWHNSSIPKTLDSLIMRLLAKDPAERPESAGEVLAALQGVDLSAVSENDREKGAGSLESMAGGVFVGRQREMDQLKALFEEALSGKGRMVTLVGEPGIGKTRTAQELATYAGMRGAQVLWGRSYESGGAPPYWPWVQAIRSHVSSTNESALRSQLGSAGPVIADVVTDVREKLPDLPAATPIDDPESARFRLFDSISTFMKQASQSAPLVLMLEDLHWADKPSLLLLEFVARELANSRLMIVGNYRDVELNRRHPLAVTLGELTRERLFERVLLRGLQKHDVERFIEIAAGITPPSALVQTVFAQTEGNPLFVTETVRLLIQEGDIASGRKSEGGTTSWEIRIPEGVREVIGRRLDRLSERCNEVLTIAAVIGRQFRFQVLKMLMEDTTDGQMLDAMDEALSARIIEELPDEVGLYQFTHASMQETLTLELSANRLVRMHARIAEALEEYYGDQADEHAAELVEHFAEAETVLGAEQIARYSKLAGEQALANHAYETAAAHFETALDHATPGDALLSADLHFGRARAWLQTSGRNQMQRVVDELLQAFDGYVHANRPDLAIGVAALTIPNVQGSEGKVDMLRRALDLPGLDDARRCDILIELARWEALESYDPKASLAASEEALKLARQSGDTSQEFRALVEQLTVIGPDGSGPFGDGQATIQMLTELVKRVDLPVSETVYYMFAGIRALNSGKLEAAQKCFDDQIAAARRSHNRWEIATALANSAMPAVFRGDWDRVLKIAEEGFHYQPEEPRLRALLLRCATETGAAELAPSVADESTLSGFTAGVVWGFHSQSWAMYVGGAIRTQAVSPDTIRSLIGDERMFAGASFSTFAWLTLGFRAVIEEDTETARAALEYLAEREIPGADSRSPLSWVSITSLIAKTAGDGDRALELAERASNRAREISHRPQQAWTAYWESDLLLDRNAPGDREKAVELQDEAIAIATELGMKPLLERVLAKREILKA